MNTRLTRDRPATYQLCLRGTLTAAWMVSLGDMTVKLVEETSQGPVTILTGEVADQAALLGLLNNIYDLGYPLLSCSLVEESGDVERNQ